MQSIVFTVIFFAILLLPGFALSQVVETAWIKRSRYLFSLGFSYALFVFALGIFQMLQISWWYFSLYIACLVIASAAVVFYCLARSSLNLLTTDTIKAGLVPIAIILSISIYHFWVGAYNEIPADIYAHLGYFQKSLSFQEKGLMGKSDFSNFFMQTGLVWYHFLAFCSKVSGVGVETTVYITTWLTKVLFLLGVYCFSSSIFEKSNQGKVIAALSVAFLSLHMGINVMAYIRYYSFAPTMLNFVLYFSAVVVFLDLRKIQSSSKLITQLLYLALLVMAAAAIHTQEALFIITMCVLISLVDVAVSTTVKLPSEQQKGFKAWLNCHISKIILLFAVFGFIVVYLIARSQLERAPNIGWRLWEFGVINDWLPKLTTLNLKYQFIRVITLWGVLIYIAVIFYWRDIRQNVFLIAGLISPVLTIMNPFFVDLFLRLDNSTTLWRMSYLIPLHLVAAFLVIKIIEDFCESRKFGVRQILGFSFIFLSILLLLPIKNTYANLHYSRFPTLVAVNSHNSFSHIDDALTALRNIEKKHIVLTDPVTGYVISGMTKHHSYRHKFLPRRYIKFSFDDYSNLPLRKHKGKLVLVNQRFKNHSEVGELSRHWSGNVLNVERYYPQVLIKHLQANTDRFSLLWESVDKDMRLYEIL